MRDLHGKSLIDDNFSARHLPSHHILHERYATIDLEGNLQAGENRQGGLGRQRRSS